MSDEKQAKIINEIRELFARARQGDAAALDSALTLLRPRLLRVIAAKLPDAAAREDVAQDTMIKILRVLPLLPKEADPYAYFLTMAKNAAVDYIRKQARYGLTENIDLLADELLDAEPADFSVFYGVIAYILSLPTAPYRVLVYLNNRFVYPARYGGNGRHRGFPGMIVDELGGFTLLRVTELTFTGIRDEFAPVGKEEAQRFFDRLNESEKGVKFADMVLIDTLGERPAAIISMWTDRINKQVTAYVIEQKNIY